MIQERKGISPIVAIVLLLMMTIAAAGGTYLWWQNIVGQQQERTEQILGTQMEIVDLVCDEQGTTDRFRVTLNNQGDVRIDASKVNVFVRSVADNSLKDTLTDLDWSNFKIQETNSVDTIPSLNSWLSLSGDIFETTGQKFRFEFNFPNSGLTVKEDCQISDLEA